MQSDFSCREVKRTEFKWIAFNATACSLSRSDSFGHRTDFDVCAGWLTNNFNNNETPRPRQNIESDVSRFSAGPK